MDNYFFSFTGYLINANVAMDGIKEKVFEEKDEIHY